MEASQVTRVPARKFQNRCLLVKVRIMAFLVAKTNTGELEEYTIKIALCRETGKHTVPGTESSYQKHNSFSLHMKIQ